MLRLATGESTPRSQRDAEPVTAQLRHAAAEDPGQSSDEEMWLAADGSDLRKPYATEMPYAIQVDIRVPGYRTLHG